MGAAGAELGRAREGQRRAHLRRHRGGQVFGRRIIAVDHPIEQFDTLARRRFRPCLEGATRRRDGGIDIRRGSHRHLGDCLFGCRVDHDPPARPVRADPCAIDQERVVTRHGQLSLSSELPCSEARAPPRSHPLNQMPTTVTA